MICRTFNIPPLLDVKLASYAEMSHNLEGKKRTKAAALRLFLEEQLDKITKDAIATFHSEENKKEYRELKGYNLTEELDQKLTAKAAELDVPKSIIVRYVVVNGL